MTKQEFLRAVRQRLAGMPERDIQRSLDFYAEMIDDQMEEGLPEAEAVAAMGTPEYAASQILMDTPLPKLMKARGKTTRALRTLEVALLILGAPIWLPLILGAGILVFSAFITVWALMFSLFAVILALGVSGIACIGALFFTGFSTEGGLALAAGLILTGITIMLALGAMQAAKGLVWLGRSIVSKMKEWFVQRGASK